MARDKNTGNVGGEAESNKPAKMRLIFQVILIVFVAVAVHGTWNVVESEPYIESESNVESVLNVSSQLAFKLRRHHGMLDTAAVFVESYLDSEVQIDVLSSACFKCPYQIVTTIDAHDNATIVFDTRFTQHLRIGAKKFSPYKLTKGFVDQATYNLTIAGNESTHELYVVLTQTYTPGDTNLPVYVFLGIAVFVFAAWQGIRILIKRQVFYRLAFFLPNDHLINTDLGVPLVSEEGTEPQRTRVKSVDTFRGLSLAIMIFVNYGGGGYWYFQHSPWDGLTVADLVFPWFVFLMGTSIAMSIKGALRRGTSRLTLFFRVVKRTIILFFLGLAISNSNVSFEKLRILGVLQRLGLTYFVVATLETISAQPADTNLRLWWSFARDLFPFWLTWLVTGCVILLHTCLTFLLPVPGCPRGYLGPGGLSDDRSYQYCTGGAARYIDDVVLGQSHMYQFPTCKDIYKTTVPYDPEGILGTLMSIFLCVLGLQAGKILITYQRPMGLVRRCLIWSAFTGVVAGVLCRFDQYDGWIPVNKNLWSLSYVLALGSMAFFLLAFFYVIIDVLQLWNGAPFIYPGMNSIVIYICHEIFEDHFPVSVLVPQTHAAQFAMDVWGTCFWMIVSGVLYYKQIFISI